MMYFEREIQPSSEDFLSHLVMWGCFGKNFEVSVLPVEGKDILFHRLFILLDGELDFSVTIGRGNKLDNINVLAICTYFTHCHIESLGEENKHKVAEFCVLCKKLCLSVQFGSALTYTEGKMLI